MKKILSILGLVGVLGIGSFAYASASDGIVENRGSRDYQNNSKYEQRMENGHHNMMDYHREDVDKALEDGDISEEEAKKWDDHYEYMDEFHNENGFRACHGRGRRGMGRSYKN